jgi:hypothetical protein
MPKKIQLLFLLLFSFAWFACKKVDIQFGDQLLDNAYTQIIKVDSFTADISTVLVDSFITSGKGVSVVGAYTDPIFGNISSNTYMDLVPPVYVDSFQFTTFDSLSLIMVPDKSYYGDTSNPIRLDVSRLTQPIIGYEDNLNTFYNNREFTVSPNLIGSQNCIVRPLRSDTIKIRLSDALGKELLKKLQDPNDNDIKTNDFFLQYFNGIRLSSPTTSNLIFGCKDSLTMRLYYKKPGLYQIGKTLDFAMSNKSHHFNNIKVDRSNTILKNLTTAKQLPSSATGNAAYTSYLGGVMTKIRFPSVRDILKLPNFTKIIKATLVVRPLRSTYTDAYQLPPLLRLASTTQLNQIGNDLAYVVNGSATAQTGSLVIDNLYGENTNYAYDVTTYVKTLTLDGTLNNNGLLLLPPSPALETRANRIVVGNKNNTQGKMELLIVYAAVQ